VSFVSRTHIAVGVLGVALWLGMAAALAWDGAGSEARRARWGAVLAAPPGCVLRWRLAPLNYRLRGRLRALPAGTLAANALGCLCTALLSVVAVRALPPVGAGGPAASWGRVATRAAQAGFCGALSTVSTLMAEAASQLRRVPADAAGYAYLGLTWVVAVVITVVAYGPAVWAK
jgi:fluoride ion exporter CrcB/FEX